jgi:hypothetical protein
MLVLSFVLSRAARVEPPHHGTEAACASAVTSATICKFRAVKPLAQQHPFSLVLVEIARTSGSTRWN